MGPPHRPLRGSEAFPKAARLLRPAEFRRVQTAGRTCDLGPLIFRAAPRPPPPEGEGVADSVRARLGLAVSRRVGGAVVRNHVKRRVRESFRKRQAPLAGLDLVVTARPAAADLDQRAVDALFDQLVSRLGRG